MPEVRRFPNGRLGQNCYVLIGSCRECVIIDPGGAAEEISSYIREKDLHPLGIVNTHAHFDHVGAVSELKAAYAIPFYLHSGDRKLLSHANLYRKLFDGKAPIRIPDSVVWLEDGLPRLSLGGFEIEIMSTPGHTEGGVCLGFEDLLFTGDTLMRLDVGRTDLPGGDRGKLKASLGLLARLPSGTRIYPGHGTDSTIGREVSENEALRKVLG